VSALRLAAPLLCEGGAMNRPALQALRDELNHPHGVGCDQTGEERMRKMLDALLAPDDAQERAFIAAQEARDPRVSGSA